VVRAECRRNSQIHRWDEVLDNNCIKDFGDGFVRVGSRGWGIRSVDQPEVYVGLITQRTPDSVLRVDITRP
jgi:hypothetical protein